MRAAFLYLLAIFLIACQPGAPPQGSSPSEDLAKLAESEDVKPVCTPTGRVRIDERRMLAFEMDCVDHKDPTLRMLGVAKRFPEEEAGWYVGPFRNAAFLPMPPDQLLVFYQSEGHDHFRFLEAEEAAGWDFVLGTLYPGSLELET